MLKITELSKRFKNKSIFKNVNLQLEDGNIYGFIGPNGSGKSVFFKTLCGFIRPTSGSVEYNGEKIGDKIDFLPDLGVLIEKPGFIENYTHSQNLEYLLSINNTVDKSLIPNILRSVGLDPNNKTKVKNFSMGMKQRLGIAQAIMENQKIVILDEPFNGLDKDGVSDIRELILNLRKPDRIILITSHIAGDIELMSDEVYEFSNNTVNKISV